MWGGGAGTNSWVRTHRGNTRDTSKVVTENNPVRGAKIVILFPFNSFVSLYEQNLLFYLERAQQIRHHILNVLGAMYLHIEYA